MAGNDFGHSLAHKADAECKQDALEGYFPTLRDAGKDFAPTLLACAVGAVDVVEFERIEVGRRMDERAVEIVVNSLWPKTFDVHCTA